MKASDTLTAPLVLRDTGEMPVVPSSKRVSASNLQFFRNGGFDQAKLETAADLAAVLELDPKLWVALSCPVDKLELDQRTLAFLDVNKDGRIRAPEVRAAIGWTLKVLRRTDSLPARLEALPLDAVSTTDDEGRLILAAARELNEKAGANESPTVTVAQVDQAVDTFRAGTFNGDGVLIPDGAEGAAREVLEKIIVALGAVKDVSGKDGVDRAKADQFFKATREYAMWWKRTEFEVDVMPRKLETPAAYAALQAVREKIDDYFARCAIAEMDRGEYETWAKPTAPQSPEQLPLSRIEPKRRLHFDEGLNPAWADRIARFRGLNQLGPTLTHDEWKVLLHTFAPHQRFVSEKPKSEVFEKLTHDELLKFGEVSLHQTIETMFDAEKKAGEQSKSLQLLAKAVHFHRDLFRFANNFVAFGEFYKDSSEAAFVNGTLYLDGRSCELCLKVDDVAKHAVLAVHSMVFLIYCECVRKSDDKKMTIVAAMTNGNGDFIMVGRNGLFVDRHGKDWDATVTRIIEQPISIREAFWTPYKRLSRFIAQQVEKFAGEKDKANPLATVTAAPAAAPVAADSKPATPAAPSAPTPAAAAAAPAALPGLGTFDAAKFAGIFATIGLAIGAIGTAAAAIISGFLGLKAWQMPIAIAGALLLISGPSMLLAAMKLRQRNLGPLLDACGWAINSRTRITIPFGESLTQLPQLPEGAHRRLTDPFARRRSLWPMFLFIMVVLGAVIAYLARANIAAHLPWHWGR